MKWIILTMYLLTLANFTFAQTTFSKVYDHFNRELGEEARNIEESSIGFIVFSTAATDALESRLGVRCIDQTGEGVSIHEYGELNTDRFSGWANSGFKTIENTYIIGASYHFNHPDSTSNLVLAEFDENGETLNEYVHYSQETTIGNTAIQLTDGSYILAGGTNETPNNYPGAVLLKLNSEFEFEWINIYPGQNQKSLVVYSIVEAWDEGWILGCNGIDYSTFGNCEDLQYDVDPVIMKIDANGNEVWREEFGNCTYECGAHVAKTSDGNYLFSSCLKTDVLSEGGNYFAWPYLVKFDSNGDTIWEETIGESNFECVLTKVFETEDGNLMAGGYRYDAGINYPHRWGLLIKLNQQGDSLWYRKYKFADDTQCFFRDVIETSDGGFAACGRTWPSEENSSIDTWVVKTDEYGCIIPGCHIGIEEFTEKYGRFKVGPNPVRQSENLTVFLPDIKDLNGLSFQLRNLSGQLVKSFVPDEGGTSYLLRMDDVTKGMYVLSLLKDGVQGQSEKVVVD
jgi:hypothetical protein